MGEPAGHGGDRESADTFGPTLIVLPEFKDPVYDQSGVQLITSSVRRSAADSLDPKIHHNNLLTSILAKIEANVAGADDAGTPETRMTLVTPTTVACQRVILEALH